jgi:hypothetical protein
MAFDLSKALIRDKTVSVREVGERKTAERIQTVFVLVACFILFLSRPEQSP